ncbi:IspD/TarI family cytidylyltransferase [Collinsella phocaeensis]|uniref:IspD/TarI family cytidylyltransferase n=1 Tax=Collinsella phocaeensis TaxID=1871016 RepID=UPI00093056E8|nr:IspD/TarI family cytidylyltransferase [Collinsella phocaeensis]
MNIAVIFAGGVGSRMRSRELPKQFLRIHGKPVIVRTVEHFQYHPEVDSIVVVCIAQWLDYCRSLLERHGLSKVAAVVPGGSNGQESIYHGLQAAEELAGGDRSIVLIHDGVRPLINEKVISDNIRSVRESGSAITCVRAKETLLVEGSADEVSDIPDRSLLRIARAPQSFWLNDIIAAHRDAISAGRHDYIDSASMMFERGYSLTPVDGPDENIKVTTPDDFFSVQAILNARENEQIYGL